MLKTNTYFTLTIIIFLSEFYAAQKTVDINQGYFNFKCVKGELFKRNCNVCVCDSKTLTTVVCSKMFCRKRVKRCKPFSSFKRNCNTCTCQFGGVEFCTYKVCPKKNG